jgi:hypothetical protein
MRVIIRFSVDGEQDGALRNKLKGKLENSGFRLLTHTATYQNVRIAETDLATALRLFWRTAATHPGPGSIDHFWLYSDKWARGPYKKKRRRKISISN